MPLIQDYLWSEVLRSAHESVCLLSFRQTFLWETKIRQFNVTISIKKDIFRFQVPVDYILLMQLLES